MTVNVGSTMELPYSKFIQEKGTADSKGEPRRKKSYVLAFVKLRVSGANTGRAVASKL